MNKELTIATINALYDGIGIASDHIVRDWTYKFLVNRFPSRKTVRKMLDQSFANPVEEVIERSQPDIIIATEVMPHFTPSKTITALKEHGYTTHIGEGDQQVSRAYFRDMQRCIVIGSRLEFQPIPELQLTGTHAGIGGVMLPEHSLSVIGAHPSFASHNARNQQLAQIETLATEQVKKGRRVVVAGDLNADASEVAEIFDQGKWHDHTDLSFPHPSIMENLNQFPWKWIRSRMQLENGPRNLDHIILSNGIRHNQTISYWPNSDHAALNARIRI